MTESISKFWAEDSVQTTLLGFDPATRIRILNTMRDNELRDWLNKTRAAAWDEGYAESMSDEQNDVDSPTSNPYLQEAPVFTDRYDDSSREDVLATLRAHRIECTGPGEVTCFGCRERSWMTWGEYYEHVVDAVLNALGIEAGR